MSLISDQVCHEEFHWKNVFQVRIFHIYIYFLYEYMYINEIRYILFYFFSAVSYPSSPSSFSCLLYAPPSTPPLFLFRSHRQNMAHQDVVRLCTSNCTWAYIPLGMLSLSSPVSLWLLYSFSVFYFISCMISVNLVWDFPTDWQLPGTSSFDYLLHDLFLHLP